MIHKIGFLLDMDGVIDRGSKLIPGASDFIRRLRKHGIPFRFLTGKKSSRVGTMTAFQG